MASPSLMLSSGMDCACVLSDRHKWCPIWRGTGHKQNVAALGFEPTLQLAASGGKDRRICLWDVRTCGGRPTLVLPRFEPVIDVEFSRSHAHLLAAAYEDQTVRYVSMCQ